MTKIEYADPEYNDPGEKYRPNDILVQCPAPDCTNAFWQRKDVGTPLTCGQRCGQRLRSEREHRGGLNLTPRETVVAGLLTEGLTNAAIAKRMGITPATLRNMVSSVYRKTGR
jgi:DNA-binding CsgD family transcriptional regulator